MLSPDPKISNNKAFCGTINYAVCGTTGGYSDYGSPKEGKLLFRNNCAPCHNKNMKDDMTGPALQGSLNQWNRDSVQLKLYFSDSPAYLDTTKDARLIALKEKWKPTISHGFRFTVQEVKDIMSYVEGQY